MTSAGRWLVLLALGFGLKALAVVRTLTMDEDSMAVIHLAMGRSTVLHFHEKPTKVVAGNQNYFNIEFTGNDLTIQPLGPITSNLFAYGEYHRYGFILRVGGSEGYDDLVDIRWKSSTLIPLRAPSAPVIHEENKLVSSKNLKLGLTKVLHKKGFHAFEVTIQDKDGRGIEAKNVEFRITQREKLLPLKEVAFEKEKSDSKDPLKARVFVTLSDKSGVTIKVAIQGRTAKLTVPRSALE